MIFKSIFTFFKNLKTQDIFLCCDATGMRFYGWDHSKVSRVYAAIEGASVNWYYCRAPIQIGFNREYVGAIFASIDKSFYKISLTYSREDPEHFNIILRDPEIDKECSYKIATSVPEPDDKLFSVRSEVADLSLERFPIQFTLTTKQFKKTISDAGSYSDDLTIEKPGDRFLQFSYCKIGIVNYHEVYHSHEKIKLISSVQAGQVFRCVIKLNNIRSFVSSMVTDDIRILCRAEEDILFRSIIDDGTLVIYTMTRIN